MTNKYNFIDNKPLGNDLFEGKSQDRTSKVICNILNDNKFQVIGIDGGWGVGKSNLVKIVDKSLDSHDFFIYDVWGHQEDDQRRALLIELTEFLSLQNKSVFKSARWKKKLTDLLSKRKEVSTENLPHLSAGFIWSLFMIIYTPTIVVFKSEISSWLNIESIFWKLALVLFPLVVVLFIYLFHLIKNWVLKFGFWKSFRLSFQETFQVYANKQKKETKIESISEEEPSVRDFQNWMSDIDADLKSKKLVLVLDNFDRLPKEHILNVWSSVHMFFAEKTYSNIKVIVPFDRQHIKSAFNNNKIENFTDDYINKTFDIVFRVSPPILSSWKEFFKTNWKKAFGTSHDENEYEHVEHAYEILRPSITPREIVAFINDFVTIKLFDAEIPDRYIALFLLRQAEILKDPLGAIVKLKYLSGLEPIYRGDEDFEKYITALAFQINPENALEVVYKRKLRNSLANNEKAKFEEITKTSVFNSIIVSVVNELEDLRNPILTLDSLSEIEEFPKSKSDRIWQQIFHNLKDKNLNEGNLEEYQMVLLKNLKSLSRRSWLRIILKSLWIISEDFDISNYIKNIDKVITFCDEEKLDLNPLNEIESKEVSAEQLKTVIDLKETEYSNYKFKCEIEEIDEFLAAFGVEDIDKASFCNFLDKPIKFKRFNENLHSLLKVNKANKEHVYKILAYLKLTSIDKIDISADLTDADVYALMNQVTEIDPLFIDLAAIRVSFLNSSHASYQTVYNKALNSPNEDIYYKVAKEIEWYIYYDDLLIGSVSFTNQLVKGVVKEMIKLDPEHRAYDIQLLLENLLSITRINNLNTESILENIKDVKTEHLETDKIIELDSSILEVLLDSKTGVAKVVIDLIKKFYKGQSKDEWEEIFNELDSPVFKRLKAIKFNEWNGFALEEFKTLLLNIVENNSIENKGFSSWLITSFEGTALRLDNAYKNVRDKLIRENNINPELFTLFIEPLIKHGHLEEKADDVIRTIFNPELLDNESCIQNMINFKDDIKSLLDRGSKTSKSDFREGLKARSSDKTASELGKVLGFRIREIRTGSKEE